MVSVKVYILAFFLMIFMIAYPILTIKNKVDVKTGGKKKKGHSEKDGYFEPLNPWEDPEPKVYPSFNNIGVCGTNICNTYTYENLFEGDEFDSPLSTVVNNLQPNINNVFSDYVDGLNHIQGKFSTKCIGPDQVRARFESLKCKSLVNEKANQVPCYGPDGEKISPGTARDFSVSCIDRPLCGGTLGTYSFNVNLTPDNFISKDTLCLSLEKLRIPEKQKSDLENELIFYENLGIIEYDSTLGVSGVYYPTFQNKRCNTYDPKQKLLINKYQNNVGVSPGTCIEKSLNINTQGIYHEIIFRPLDAYLDMDFSGVCGIQTFELQDPGMGFFPGITEIINTNTEGKNAKCSLGIATSGNGELINISLTDFGTSFLAGETYTIKNPNTDTNPNAKDGSISVINVFEVNPNIVFKTRNKKNLSDTVRWFFSTPILSNRIPSRQTCTALIPNLIKSKAPDWTYKPKSKEINLGDEFIPTLSKLPDNSFITPVSFCSVFPPNYPPYSIISTTSKTEIDSKNFFYFYYNTQVCHHCRYMSGGDMRDADQSAIHYFDPVPSIPPDNSICKINTTEFVISNPFRNTFSFSPEYFYSISNSVKTIKSPGEPGNVYPIKDTDSSFPSYVETKVGLINTFSIDSTGSDLTNSRIPGIYALTPRYLEGADPDTSLGKNSKFVITIEKSVSNNDLKSFESTEVKNIVLVEKGENYKENQTLIFYGIDMGAPKSNPGTNIIITVGSVEDEYITLVSYPMTTANNPIPLTERDSGITIGDFSIAGKIEKSESGDLFFETKEDNVNDSIAGRGFGMQPGTILYMYQEDTNQTIDSNITTQIIKDNALQLTCETIISPRYEYESASPYSLEKPGFNLGYLTNQSFNFMEVSTGFYNPSPPQLVYLGEKNQNEKTLLETFVVDERINSSEGFKKFLLKNKVGSREDFDTIPYLKSLQFQELNYDYNNSYKLSENSQFILGRFIPFSSFTPQYQRIKDKTIEKVGKGVTDTETDTGTLYYGVSNPVYNNNYTSLIPFGSNNFYFTRFV